MFSGVGQGLLGGVSGETSSEETSSEETSSEETSSEERKARSNESQPALGP